MIIKKREIKCLECSQNDNNPNKNKVIEEGNNIFNSINRNQLNDLLNLPNYYGFNKLNEN